MKDWSVRLLESDHQRGSFDCGTPVLNRYLQQRAMQDMRRQVATCYTVLGDRSEVLGYYTTAMASIPLQDIEPELQRKLPRYPSLPAARIGRLAVDLSMRGVGLGAALLVDAILRAARSDIASFAVIVDAKDDNAVSFYRRHGFVCFESLPMSLYLPLSAYKQ